VETSTIIPSGLLLVSGQLNKKAFDIRISKALKFL
jgi:hypothetical protein